MMIRASALALRLFGSLSAVGLILGLLLFAISLTPSLMPRSYLVQGALAGVSAAVGYLLGVVIAWVWRYLELPQPRRPALQIRLVTAAFAVIVVVASLWHTTAWQNSIRVLWGMEPLDSADPLRLAGIAAATFAILFVIGRLFRIVSRRFSWRLKAVAPRRVARVAGTVLAIALFVSIGQGVLLRFALDAADASFAEADRILDTETPPPTDPTMTGSSQSLVSWDGIGRQGRHFIASGPRADAIGAFWAGQALDPLRIYVGLNSAASAEERAELALREMQRQGAFERSVLVVIAPTGTGWVDPAAMDTLEYLHRGDVASVAVQYSYLTSWLSLLVEAEKGRDAASALLDAVYSHWKSMPGDSRPKLYLHGLSLGALNSQEATDIYDIVGDPFQGALWSGPPFRSEMWRSLTARREQGSPAWLPRVKDGSVVRFANQNQPPVDGAAWGPIRFIYLQYASDPVVFFEPTTFYREPQWMQGERGPDVSPDFQWVPIVTGLQLVFDMAIATTSPIGYGHVYAPEHYIDAWIELTDPQGVPPEDVIRLKDHLDMSAQ